jgi:hypothetical protein
MKLSQVLALNSDRGIRSVISALTFGAKQRLLSVTVQYERMTRTIHSLNQAGFADRASDVAEGKAFKASEQRTMEAANTLSILIAAADSRGIVVDLDIEPTMRRLMDQKQMALAAESSGLTVEEITKAAVTSAKMQFEQEQQAAMLAQSLFYTACGEETDLDVKAESVLSALQRERGRIITFSNILPYLGDLALLKKDIEVVEWIIANTVEGEADPDVVDMIVPTAPAASTKKRRVVKKQQKAIDEGCEPEDIRDAEVAE